MTSGLSYLVNFTKATSAQQVQEQVTVIQRGVIFEPDKHKQTK